MSILLLLFLIRPPITLDVEIARSRMINARIDREAADFPIAQALKNDQENINNRLSAILNESRESR